MNKLRSSTKIAIGFAVIVAGSLGGYKLYADYRTPSTVFPPLTPGRVNIVGVNPGAGYRIIVANSVAQLVETQGGFGSNDDSDKADDSSTSDDDGSVKKKISIADMLGSLRGDKKSLTEFVMKIDDLKPDDLPPVEVQWSADDLKKALAGDPKLQAKLESDLNMKLDGTPLPEMNMHSLENGIVVEAPVTVQVNLNGRLSPVSSTVPLGYKPSMIRAVEADYADKANPDAIMRAGYYKQEAERLVGAGSHKEDIRRTLTDMISDSAAKERVADVERFLASAMVVVNDGQIDTATYSTYSGTDGKPMHDLSIHLTEEGRQRLAQFSKDRVGSQLLLVSDGVAIAAPRITQRLLENEVHITRMADESLLQDFQQTLSDSKIHRIAQQ